MITIHHNFDETKFKWLWAKYVKAGNIEKHCTACLIGPYSKKFSGSANKDLLSQPVLQMDEAPDGQYEAIYFCGVLKKGYLNKDPLKNNYPHNVHFAVRPAEGETDVWDFENWHVEIKNGKLERIPATYELSEKFFKSPYNAHYYTCRIFRWMVGHFYENELVDILGGLPVTIMLKNGTKLSMRDRIYELIDSGYRFAEFTIRDSEVDAVKSGRFNRREFLDNFFTNYSLSCGYPLGECFWLENFNDEEVNDTPYTIDVLDNFLRIGMNEYLDMIATYQER